MNFIKIIKRLFDISLYKRYFNRPSKILIGNLHLKQELTLIAERYFNQMDRSSGIVATDIAKVGLDGAPEYVQEMMSRRIPHDDDYIIFRIFNDDNSLILDIGANWGYSVGSLHAVGAQSRVVSFEAIPLYRSCLQAVSDLRPDRHTFFMNALSDKPGSLRFVIPVVNGVALSALTSASENPCIVSLVSNIEIFILKYMTHAKLCTLQFCEFVVPVQTLDNIVSLHPEVFQGCGISAMKIDVEGLEFEVLKGAEKVLKMHKPLVMAEGGNRHDGLREFMSAINYLYAERRGERLELFEGVGSTSNGFFVHTSMLPRYRELGVLI